MRTIALRVLPVVTLAALLGSALVQCSSDSSSSTAPDAASDGPAELCDLNAYSGVGKPCPYVSPRLCFKQCTIGGCKCVASASGPVWSCVTDLSCLPDSGPLDDAPSDTASPVDAPSDG